MLIYTPTKTTISPDLIHLLQKLRIEQLRIEQLRKEYLRELYELRLKYSKKFKDVAQLGDEYNACS